MIPHQYLLRLIKIKVAVFLLLAVRSHAGPILSLTFDDPGGVFGRYSEGISLWDKGTVTLSEAEIASGLGGKAQLKIDSTEWVEGSTEPPKSFQLVTDPVMGTKAFLRLILDKQVPGTRGLAVIIPNGIETSLASLSQIEKGKVVFNGGLDLFFRYNEESPSQPELVPNILHTGGYGLHLEVESDGGSVIALFTDGKNENIFDTDLDGTADANRVKTLFVQAVPIDPEAMYHLAISLETQTPGS